MMLNTAVYLALLLQILISCWLLIAARRHSLSPLFAQVLLLLPSILLLVSGFLLAIDKTPDQVLRLSGYQVTSQQTSLHLGSDEARDDVLLSMRYLNQEQITPGLLTLTYLPADDQIQITQNDPLSSNVIYLESGRTIRSMPLAEGQEHQITFGKFDYSSDPETTLYLTIRNGKPEFRYKDRIFTQGFVLKGLLDLVHRPFGEGVVRHLSVKNRIDLSETGYATRALLQQASLVKIGETYWLNANDADIRLNNIPFLNSVYIPNKSTIRWFNYEIGSGTRQIRLEIAMVQEETETTTTLSLSPKSRKSIAIKMGNETKRIALARSESYFENTRTFRDPNFDSRPLLLTKSKQGLLLRGTHLPEFEPFVWGKCILVLERLDLSHVLRVLGLVLICLLFTFFYPLSCVKRNPHITVIFFCCVFLLAFRTLLAFRVWQGQPFHFDPFKESLAMPLLFTIIVFALNIEGNFWAKLKWIIVKTLGLLGTRRPSWRVNTSLLDVHFQLLIPLIVLGLLFLGMGTQLPIEVVLLSLAIGVMAPLAVYLLKEFENLLDREMVQVAHGFPWWNIAIISAFILMLTIPAPLFGGQEVLPFGPRIRPDVLTQVVLTLFVACLAAIWLREARYRVTKIGLIFATYSAVVVLTLAQGFLANDYGFTLMIVPPLILILIPATWHLHRLLPVILVTCACIALVGPSYVSDTGVFLDKEAGRRITFILNRDLLKATYFHDYLAQLPITWVSNQGFFGGGLFTGDWYISLASTSVNDNVASVFIKGELGSFGTILVCLLFSVIAFAGFSIVRQHQTAVTDFRLWFIAAVTLSLVWTVCVMFWANLGYFPLTGKNLPFLGLDSVNDTLRYSLLIGLTVRFARQLKERTS